MRPTSAPLRCALLTASLLIATIAGGAPAAAQAPPPRTLEELKAETQARADRNAYPLIGLKPDEVREALSRLTSLDRDEWAASWSLLGDRYMAKSDFIQAWLYYSFARWPVPNSPGKQRAYEKALSAYLAHASRLDPPLEIVRIPFEGKEIVGYLRLPPNTTAPAPLILAVSGLDSRKETMADSYNALIEHGIG
jgi:esterase FrsA